MRFFIHLIVSLSFTVIRGPMLLWLLLWLLPRLLRLLLLLLLFLLLLLLFLRLLLLLFLQELESLPSHILDGGRFLSGI